MGKKLRYLGRQGMGTEDDGGCGERHEGVKKKRSSEHWRSTLESERERDTKKEMEDLHSHGALSHRCLKEQVTYLR